MPPLVFWLDLVVLMMWWWLLVVVEVVVMVVEVVVMSVDEHRCLHLVVSRFKIT
jgi:hypothetical protein